MSLKEIHKSKYNREYVCPFCGDIHFISSKNWKNFFNYGEENGFWQLTIFSFKWLIICYFLINFGGSMMIHFINNSDLLLLVCK